MKARELLVARIGVAVLAGGLLGGPQLVQNHANAQVNLSVGIDIRSPTDFYTPLGAYGSWVEVPRYGRCWRPASVVTGWRPYTNGHWEWTDVGWYWVSDEPWGWACYHYGYWNFDPAYGWVWIPGTEWSPAWVTWREAPDYVGWAPCGPGGIAVADSFFVFVDVHHFHDRLGPRELVFNDPRVYGRSRPTGGFRREDHDFDGGRRRIAFNRGPDVAAIQRATGVRFEQRPVRELVRQTRVPDSIRREPERPQGDRPLITQQPQQSKAVREQPRIYRDSPTTHPPTGRQQPRIYREVPNPQPVPQPAPPTTAPPRREPRPEIVTPPRAPTGEQVEPPKGQERGRPEGQVRREEPSPNPHSAPPPGHQQEREDNRRDDNK